MAPHHSGSVGDTAEREGKAAAILAAAGRLGSQPANCAGLISCQASRWLAVAWAPRLCFQDACVFSVIGSLDRKSLSCIISSDQHRGALNGRSRRLLLRRTALASFSRLRTCFTPRACPNVQTFASHNLTQAVPLSTVSFALFPVSHLTSLAAAFLGPSHRRAWW